MIRMTIALDPDINDLGWPRKRDAEPWPREFTTVSIPLGWPHVGQITIPKRMTQREWDLMLECFQLMHRAFVASDSPEKTT